MKNRLHQKLIMAVLWIVIGGIPGMTTAIPTITATVKGGDVIVEHAYTVTIGDLDLSKQRGVVSLYDRLKTAADRACDFISQDYRTPGMQRLNRLCYTETLANAVQAVDNDNLTYLHANAK